MSVLHFSLGIQHTVCLAHGRQQSVVTCDWEIRRDGASWLWQDSPFSENPGRCCRALERHHLTAAGITLTACLRLIC